MPDRKELLEAALAILTSPYDLPTDPNRLMKSLVQTSVDWAKELLSAVDAECGCGPATSKQFCDEAGLRLRQQARMLGMMSIPEVRALVEAAEKADRLISAHVKAEQERTGQHIPTHAGQVAAALHKSLRPFRRERSA